MKNEGVYDYRLVLGEGPESIREIPEEKRKADRFEPARPAISSEAVAKALLATPGADLILDKVPNLKDWTLYLPTATFSVCQKTGTATYLDLWNVDHFDNFTDMQANLSECRVWFSANGYSYWGSPETKSGVVNCYFRAPTAGNYVCNVQLQSHGGPATVECLIDSFSYGPLNFNGSISQPHPFTLSAGYHHFRIKQMSGSFFFNSLSVWKV